MQMVVTDLDGTLLRSDKSISKSTMNVLNKLNADGVKIVIATARPLRSVLKLFPNDYSNYYIICYNGAEIYNNDNLIYKKYIDVDQVKYIIDWLYANYSGIEISFEIDDQLYANFDANKIPGWNTTNINCDFNVFDHKPTAKILVNLSKIKDLSEIMKMLPESCTMVVTDKGSLGQIVHKGVSKANGVKYLAKLLGYELDDIIAFGDDYNDMDIIMECGIGVAMANAEEALKEVADIIAATNDEDGVAGVLEKYISQ